MSDQPLPARSFATGLPPTDQAAPAQVNVGYVAIPKLDRLMELRDALVVLKGPLANNPSLRENVQNLLINEETNDRVLGKISSPLPRPIGFMPFG